MSVTMKPATRTPFAGKIPALLPLYANCEAWQLPSDGEWICGGSSDCELHISLEGLAARHCIFTLRAGTFIVQRLEGHIWVNDLPVPREAVLLPGDTISVGPVSFRIEAVQRPVVSAAAPVVESMASIPTAEPASGSRAHAAPVRAVNPVAAMTTAPLAASDNDPLTAALLLALQQHQHAPAPAPAVASSLFADQRLALLESKERILEQRELHMQELSHVALERERALQQRAAAQDDRLEILNRQKEDNEHRKTTLDLLREELEKLRSELAEQKLSVETQAAENQGRAQEMQARTEDLNRLHTELTQKADELARQKREQEESRVRATRSVEQLTAIAAEREQAVRARQEAATMLRQLNDTRAAHAEELARLDSLSKEISERQTRLEAAESRVRDEQIQREQAQACLNAELTSAELKSATLSEERAGLQIERNRLVEERATIEPLLNELANQRAALEAEQKDLAAERTSVNADRAAVEAERAVVVAERAVVVAERQALETERAMSAEELTKLAADRNQLQERQSLLETELARLAEERAAIEQNQVTLDTHPSARDVQQTQLSVNQTEQSAWQAELDSRHAELAGRLSLVKAARAAVLETARAQAMAARVAADEIASIEQQRSVLLAREVELAQADSRIDELQRAVSMQKRTVEAEREALQNSHKDLICERNSLMQSSQDIQSRSANVIEREAMAVKQMEELRSRFDALNRQDAELRKVDAELNSRASELHHRVLQFKQESRAFRSQHRDAANEGVTEDRSPLTSTAENRAEESLRVLTADEAEEKLAHVQQERDSLLTAVRELQSAMINARADVEEAHQIRQAAAQQDQSLASLYQTLEERSGQLQLMESHLCRASEQVETLQAQMAELNRRLENAPTSESFSLLHEGGSGARESISELSDDQTMTEIAASEGDSDRLSNAESSAESDLESHLLQELEAMRRELQVTRSAQKVSLLNATAEPDTQIQVLLEQISELQSQLQAASQLVGSEDPGNMIEVAELRSRIDRLECNLRDRDELIVQLRTRLQQLAQQEAVNEPDLSEITTRENAERELDRRAELLDEREGELRERIRKVTQTEEDMESQRRELSEARQQLEIARCEVQAALHQHSAVTELEFEHRGGDRATMRSGNEHFSTAILEEPGLNNGVWMDPPALSDQHDSSEASALSGATDMLSIDDTDGSHDLRAELANLFGLKKSAPIETPVENRPTPPRPDFVDLSQPTGDSSAVELSFESNMADIEHPTSSRGDDDSSSPREENSDDFVRDYMEQLLARSRKAAGNSLPSELKPPGQSSVSSPQNVPMPKKAAEPKGPPKPKSFIDDYMSGGFKDLDAEPAAGNAMDSEPVNSSLESAVARTKVDVQKLRENMNSFRTLSAQSTENALINHAMRTERLSINGRIMLSFVMIFMAVFLTIANMKGIIDHPSLIWVTVVGAFASVAELIRKLISVKSRCKVAMNPEHDDAARKTHAQPTAIVPILSEAMAPEPLNPPMPEIVPEEVIRSHQLSEELAAPEEDSEGRMESERTEYFEL